MIRNFEKNQIIKIVPGDVENACNGVVLSVEDDGIIIKLQKTEKVINGECECFALSDAGIFYFRSFIEQSKNELYRLAFPSEYNLMQRREYSRVNFDASLVLKAVDSNIEVKVTDLSAGGMKVVSPVEIQMSMDYSFSMVLGKNREVAALFSPIRQEKEGDFYSISGKFNQLSNKDRISIAQYCFSKQMESINK